MTNMKDFANEVRMISKFKKTLEYMVANTKMSLTDTQIEKLAEMMVGGFNGMVEATLVQVFVKDEEVASYIGKAIEEEANDLQSRSIRILYDVMTELIMVSLSHEALLFAALGGLNKDED